MSQDRSVPMPMNPFHYMHELYGDRVRAYTAELAKMPNWWLHISFLLREAIPGIGIVRGNARFVVDVFEHPDTDEEVREIWDHRNQALKRYRSESSRSMAMIYAEAAPVQRLDPITRPWPVVLNWDNEVPLDGYLRTLTGIAADELLASAVYTVSNNEGQGKPSTLVVELFRNKEAAEDSLDLRSPNWYSKYHEIDPPSQEVRDCAIISARLPDQHREIRVNRI